MERIFVAVRARPLSPDEAKSSPWRISGNSIHLASQSSKFEFDRIFGEDCRTIGVYEARTKEIVASAVRGFNGTVFAYGQTNSGKTYTMRGSVSEPGIIPLAVHDLFQKIQEDMDREFLVRMSYVEIYNEEINDLLVPEHRKLQIHESLERGIYVAGLREEIVTCPEQVLDLMEFGESHRHIGETNMNLHSSRSHTIFRMIVESRERIELGEMVDSCDAVRVSVLNLVDLAGSERAAKTGAEGMRLKEGSHINKSLMILGTVIKKLSEGAESQGGHVPYRDSKLTRILQPALGGNANTSIICNITLAQVHADETKSSLQFASRALRVTNCACVNEILTDAALLRRQRKEIEELRAKLMSSHSDHLEEEILNLRNTLLQSELEKERIALELEEEKKRLLVQEKKITNLSSLVLCSERDDKSTYKSKNKRRVTWCPVPASHKSTDEVHIRDSAAKEHIRHGSDAAFQVSFPELIHENFISMDDTTVPDACKPDGLDSKCNDKDFPFPDAHALLHVTDRRKIHAKSTMILKNSQKVEFEGSQEFAEFTPVSPKTICKGEISKDVPCEQKTLTERESEAILVKKLQEQIKLLETEKASIQCNLDDVLELTTKQFASLKDKYNEEDMADFCRKFSEEVQELEVLVDHSKNFMDGLVSINKELFHDYSVLENTFLELKSSANQNVTQLKFITTEQNKIQKIMLERTHELEKEKNILHEQSVDYRNRIDQLTSELDSRDKTMHDLSLQHDLEKDELLSQVLTLQKEVSCLSSSALIKEKETIRKELDRIKTKLKDTDSKLKNAIQDKIKLESEKAQGEREIKRLQSQNVVLERDMLKRNSLNVKRHEPRCNDYGRQRVVSTVEQTLQEDYQKLEPYIFEMENEITSLKEALISALGEKEEAASRNEFLHLEFEALSEKLAAADSEMLSLREEIAVMGEKLVQSESFSKELKSTIDALSSEKEEMGVQFADALLEMEAEKSIWLEKERAFFEVNEKFKVQNVEIQKLSENLLQAKQDLESFEDECRELKGRLVSIEENSREEKERSMAKSSEINQLRNELKQHLVDADEKNEVKSKFEALLSEHHHTCEELRKLQEHSNIISGQQDESTSLVMNTDQELLIMKARAEADKLSKMISDMEAKMHTDGLCYNIERTKHRMQLRSMQATLDAYRSRYKESLDEIGLMNNEYEKASTKLKKKLSDYAVEILNLRKQIVAREG